MTRITTTTPSYERDTIKMLKSGTTVDELIAYSMGYNNALSDYGHITEEEAKESIKKEIAILQALDRVAKQGGSSF
jgi:hypothetical protein